MNRFRSTRAGEFYFLVNENKAALRCMSRILAHDPKYDSLVFDSYVHSGAPAPDEAEGRGGTWHGRPARVKPFSTLTRSASTARAVPVRHGFSSYFTIRQLPRSAIATRSPFVAIAAGLSSRSILFPGWSTVPSCPMSFRSGMLNSRTRWRCVSLTTRMSDAIAT